MSTLALIGCMASVPLADPMAFPSVYWTDGDTGADLECFYSTIGTTYTEITPSLPAMGIGDNAYNGSGTWVACPPSSATANEIYVSSNPLVGWATYSLSFQPSGVCWDGTRFLIAGSGGNVAYAVNPAGSWTSWTSGVSTALNCIEFGNGKYAIGGTTNVLRVATSLGGSFTSRLAAGTGTSVNCIKYNSASSGRWLACGTAGQVMYTTDANMAGTNWTRYAVNSVQWNYIACDDTNWCIIGNSRAGYSSNPTVAGNWTNNGPWATANGWCVKYSAALGLWIALGVNFIRTTTGVPSTSSTWTNRMPGGTSGAQNARKGLIVTS